MDLQILLIVGWVHIHHLGHQVCRCQAVGESVVNLADHREAMLRHALDEIHFPQWTASVQRRRRDVADQLVEFATAPGRAHLNPAQMVVQVKSGVSNHMG